MKLWAIFGQGKTSLLFLILSSFSHSLIWRQQPLLCVYLDSPPLSVCTRMIAQLQRHFIFPECDAQNRHSHSFYEWRVYRSGCAVLLVTMQMWLKTKVMEILSPFILLKTTVSITSSSGNDSFNWTASSRLSEFCFSLFWETYSVAIGGPLYGFLGEGKAFQEKGPHSQDACSHQHKPSSEVINSIMFPCWDITDCLPATSARIWQLTIFINCVSLAFSQPFFTSMSIILNKNRPFKGSYHIPKEKGTKQNLSI